MSHLDDMLNAARARVSDLPDLGPARCQRPGSLERAVGGRRQTGVIATYQRTSPTGGAKSREDPLLPVLKRMLLSGVSAVRVVTEHSVFGGSLLDLELARSNCPLPLVMSDVAIDPAFVRVAAALGADAVELVARVLSDEQLGALVSLCRELGCTPLVQCWNEQDLQRALALPETPVYLTDTDLDSLKTDPDRIPGLLDQVPGDRLLLASGDLEDGSRIATLRGRVDGIVSGPEPFRTGTPKALIEEITH